MVKMTRRESTDPRPDAFEETNDPGAGAFASGGATTSGSQVSMVSTAANSLRAMRCAYPGCGKSREDPIHAPADD
jgi:hypothetical protein